MQKIPKNSHEFAIRRRQIEFMRRHSHRPVTNLGHQGEEEPSEKDPNFLNYAQ